MTEPEAAAAEDTSFEWSAYYDDEGRLYFYNGVTEESSWDPPADGKYNPPPPEEEEEEEERGERNLDANEAAAAEADDVVEAAEAEKAKDAAESAEGEAVDTVWVAYKDDEGREYYYNTETGESQWEKPDSYVEEPPEGDEAMDEIQQEDEGKSDVEMSEAKPAETDRTSTLEPSKAEGGYEADLTSAEPAPEEVPEEIIDPAVKRLQDAEAALNQTDSILEPNCMSNVSEVVTSEGGNPQKAISALIEKYEGQTAVCGLLGRWLSDLQTSSSTSASSSNERSQASTDQVREIVQDVINRAAKERFSKEIGDRILELSKSEAAFLEDMMDSPRWRKLLIDLSASHKDSAVLVYCLRAISKRGHHREIAKRVNQSDHFAVFNAMLQSELSIIGKVAVSSESDAKSSIGLGELVDDLRRACCSTSYTYLYSIEVLRFLETQAKKLAEDSNSNRFSRAIRKWQALGQNLESSMIDPATSSSVAGSSHRVRRLDVALTASELHQRQRRRRKPLNGNGDSNGGNEESVSQKEMETGLLNFLRRYSLGIQLDDAAVDPLLPTSVDLNATDDMGILLIQHPLSVQALLGYLYKPGSTRVTSPVLRNKCGRLISFAVLAAEKAARNECSMRDIISSTTQWSDEVALTRMIVQGSQLCEQLESMISFLVSVDTTDTPGPISASSPGEKLCSLTNQCAAVAQGVIMWAREFTHGPDFASSASFATLSVSILSLVRVICLRYPFTRRDGVQVALAFLRHSNSDVSYQKLYSIKEQSLRLLVILLCKGEVASVLGSVTRRLQQQQQGVSDMDASLVRYFVGSILECVRQPVSVTFIESFGALLKAPQCVDAVRSTNFDVTQSQQLKELLESFSMVKMSPETASLVSSLCSLYGSDQDGNLT